MPRLQESRKRNRIVACQSPRMSVKAKREPSSRCQLPPGVGGRAGLCRPRPRRGQPVPALPPGTKGLTGEDFFPFSLVSVMHSWEGWFEVLQNKYSLHLKTALAFEGLCAEHSPLLARLPPASCRLSPFRGASPTPCVPSFRAPPCLWETPLPCPCARELCPCPTPCGAACHGALLLLLVHP